MLRLVGVKLSQDNEDSTLLPDERMSGASEVNEVRIEYASPAAGPA